jgi:hypothetical protein
MGVDAKNLQIYLWKLMDLKEVYSGQNSQGSPSKVTRQSVKAGARCGLKQFGSDLDMTSVENLGVRSLLRISCKYGRFSCFLFCSSLFSRDKLGALASGYKYQTLVFCKGRIIIKYNFFQHFTKNPRSRSKVDLGDFFNK